MTTNPRHRADDPKWETATRYLWACIGGLLIGAWLSLALEHAGALPHRVEVPPVETPITDVSTACTVEVIDGAAVVSCVG